jgi:type I restriction enzyme S subunit
MEFMVAAYPYVRDAGNETSQMNLNAQMVGKIKVPVPPIHEQTDIVENLRQKIGVIDNLANRISKSLDLTQERRAALITAAVTGQIDVRDAA